MSWFWIGAIALGYLAIGVCQGLLARKLLRPEFEFHRDEPVQFLAVLTLGWPFFTWLLAALGVAWLIILCLRLLGREVL